MFIAYNVSIDLIRALQPLIPSVRRFNSDIADQLQRAATSVALNLAEGRRRRAGNQRRSFEIAHGEASEVRACLDVVAAWGWVVDSDLPLRTLDRLLALLWRLCRGRHKRHYAESRIMPSCSASPTMIGSSDSA